MNALLVSLRKEWLEQWRTRRLLISAAVLLAFGMLSPLTARFTREIVMALAGQDAVGVDLAQVIPEATVRDAVAQYVKNIGQFSVILALLLTMGVVAQEKERGTAALMLVKPLPRWAFVAAKFLGLAAGFGVSLVLAGVAAYYYTWVLFEPLPLGGWLALNALLLVFILVYVALTLLASVLARSQTAAGGLGFAFMLLLALPGVVPQVGRWLPGELLNWGGALAAGAPVEPAWRALAVSAALIVAALAVAMLAFRRQEL